jgi:hypothetical protein
VVATPFSRGFEVTESRGYDVQDIGLFSKGVSSANPKSRVYSSNPLTRVSTANPSTHSPFNQLLENQKQRLKKLFNLNNIDFQKALRAHNIETQQIFSTGTEEIMAPDVQEHSQEELVDLLRTSPALPHMNSYHS